MASRATGAVRRSDEVPVEAGTGADLFGRPWPTDPSMFAIRRLVVDGAVVVLGRSSPVEVIDAHIAGIPAVTRSTGGGAVWLDARMVWLDVWVPSMHPRWNDDVGRACWWIGFACKAGLSTLMDVELHVHVGAMVRHPLDRLVCWLGLGPGEVHDSEGRKVVGIAQRRTRSGALFQIGALVAPSQHELARVLSIDGRNISADDIAKSERACLALPDAVATSLTEAILEAAFNTVEPSGREC